MEQIRLEICKLSAVSTTFKNSCLNSMTFEWVERSSYCLYPDEEVSIDIDRESAIKLITLLNLHFKL